MSQSEERVMNTSDAAHKNSKTEEHIQKKENAFVTCVDWMTSELHTVGPKDSVDQAWALLRTHRINQLPVVGDGMLIGIVTDRDLRGPGLTAVGASVPQKHAAKVNAKTLIESVMTHPAIALAPHSTLINAAEVMLQQRIGAVPIADGGRLVGIITRSDILEALVVYGTGRHTRLDERESGRPCKATLVARRQTH
jgi:CBS domain-containing protein